MGERKKKSEILGGPGEGRSGRGGSGERPKNLEHTHHTHTNNNTNKHQQAPTSTTTRHHQAPTGTNRHQPGTNKQQQTTDNLANNIRSNKIGTTCRKFGQMRSTLGNTNSGQMRFGQMRSRKQIGQIRIFWPNAVLAKCGHENKLAKFRFLGQMRFWPNAVWPNAGMTGSSWLGFPGGAVRKVMSTPLRHCKSCARTSMRLSSSPRTPPKFMSCKKA